MKPFRVHVAEDVWEDLGRRIAATRFPPPSPGEPWSDGTSEANLRELLAYWRDGFDWRAQEERINALPHFQSEVDGRGLHFVHARSAEPGALPLLVTHGWPGSFWEFHRIIPLLTDPAAHAGDPRDAFHVVVPSLPGYGWSAIPDKPGCDAIARAFAALMANLGYDTYGAQGGDWGARITAQLGVSDADHIVGVHLNFPSFITPPPDFDGSGLDAADRAALEAARAFGRDDAAYLQLQSTRPQTPAFGLSDSPAGLAAWIVEKYREWTDCDGEVDRAIRRDDLLTIVTIYWVTNTIGPSMRLYHEHGRRPWNQRVPVPAGCAVFPAETSPPVRSWVERFLDVRQWTDMPRGGHFAALEQPDLLAADIRRFFRPLLAASR